MSNLFLSCTCVSLSAATHASHQRVSNEKKPEAHRLERHDSGAAPGYSQWPALPDWKWVDRTNTTNRHRHIQRVAGLCFRWQKWARQKMGKKRSHAYWPLTFTVDVKVLLYMLVSSKNCTSQQLPLSIYCYCTLRLIDPGTQGWTISHLTLKKSPWVLNHKPVFTYNADFPLKMNKVHASYCLSKLREQ